MAFSCRDSSNDQDESLCLRTSTTGGETVLDVRMSESLSISSGKKKIYAYSFRRNKLDGNGAGEY